MRNEKDVSSLSPGPGGEGWCRPSPSPSCLHTSMAILTAVWFWNRTICLRLRLSSFCSTRLMAQPRAWFTFGPNCIYRQPGSHAQRAFFSLKGKGFAWYHRENQSDMVQSRDYLLKLVQRLGPKRPVIFAGLSQGAVMSIITGLHCPNKVLAIVSMSGFVPNPAENLRDLKAPRSTPILIVHGQTDALIPIADAYRGAIRFEGPGVSPGLQDLSHGTCDIPSVFK